LVAPPKPSRVELNVRSNDHCITRVPINLTTALYANARLTSIFCIVALRPIDLRTRWNSWSFFGIIFEFVRALNEAAE
jgi:hypothetical protein